MARRIPGLACNCNDSATCHNPESHYPRCRRAEPESDAPEYLCVDCGEVEVSDLGERCIECLSSLDQNRADTEGDRAYSYEEGK